MAEPLPLDAQEAALFAKVQAADETPEVTPAPETPPAEPEVKPDEKPAESPETAPEEVKPAAEIREVVTAKGKRFQDVKTGKFVKKDGSPDPETKPEDVKPDSEFAKAKKEEERQRKVLTNFEEEKKKAREEIEAERRQVEQDKARVQQIQAQQRPEATLHGKTAREYYEFAKDMQKEGDYENAFKAYQAIEQLRAFEAQSFQQYQARATDVQFHTDMNQYIKEHPEFEYGSGTPENKMMEKVLAEWPEVYYLKGGFSRAAKIAQRLVDAESLPEYKQKLEEADKELTKLRGATQPGSGSPSTPSGPKTLLQMSDAEGEAYLRRRAAEHDQAA